MPNKKKPEGEKKVFYVTFRVNKKELSKLKAIAKLYGYPTFSDYCRALVSEHRPNILNGKK